MINDYVPFNVRMTADIHTEDELKKYMNKEQTFNGLILKAIVDEEGNKVENLDGIDTLMYKEDGTIVVTKGHVGEYIDYHPEITRLDESYVEWCWKN